MLTLELPASDIPLPTSSNSLADEQAGSGSFAVDSFNSAQAAADLLDQGEAELEPVNDAIDETTGPTDVGGDLETTLEVATVQAEADQPAEGGKKKRKRKAKAVEDQPADAGEVAAVETPTDTQREQPKPVDSLPPMPAITNKTRAQEIAETEGKCLECFMQIADTEASIENLKAQLKWLRETMGSLASRLHSLRNDAEYQPPLPLLDSPPAAAVDGSTGQTTKQADDSAKMNMVADANVDQRSSLTATANGEVNRDPDAWRKVSVESLGLPPKLAEKLAEDGLDTIGRLEDRRAEISQGREKWPKGIGAAKVTLIEDAVIKWLTTNRDSQMFKPEAATAAATEVSQPAGTADSAKAATSNGCLDSPQTSQDSLPAAALDATKPLGFAGQWEDLSAEAQQAFIIDRAAAINNGEENCLARKHPDTEKFYDAGYCSYSEEVDGEKTKLTDCVYVPGVEQDDWIRGFLAAQKVDQYEPGEAVKPVVAETLATDLYDLNDL